MGDRVVGWICDEEWIFTYQKLFYGSINEQYLALDIINLWRAKFCGKIPVAIDATSRLLESWLESTKVSNDAKRQLMSSAITQFVGLVTEKGLKGNTKKPIHEVGEDYGIPEWLINLRHEMAHGPLPSLQMLEKAVMFALDWLKDNHWDVQYGIATKCKKPTKKIQPQKFETKMPLDEVLLKLLLEYVDVMLRKFKHTFTPRKKKKASVLMQEIKSATKSETNARQLCCVLVQHKFLTTHPRNCLTTMSSDPESKPRYFKFWKCLYNLICERRQLSTLFSELVSEVASQKRDSEEQSVLCCWIEHVIDAIASDMHSSVMSQAHRNDLMLAISKLYACYKCPATVNLLRLVEDKLPDIANSWQYLLLKELHTDPGKTIMSSKTPDSVCTLGENSEFPNTLSSCDLPAGPWKTYIGKSLHQIGLLDGQSANTLFETLLGLKVNTEEINDTNEQAEMVHTDTDINIGFEVEHKNLKSGLQTFSDSDWYCLEKMLTQIK